MRRQPSRSTTAPSTGRVTTGRPARIGSETTYGWLANTEGVDRQVPIEGGSDIIRLGISGTYIEVSIPVADGSKWWPDRNRCPSLQAAPNPRGLRQVRKLSAVPHTNPRKPSPTAWVRGTGQACITPQFHPFHFLENYPAKASAGPWTLPGLMGQRKDG